MFSKFHSLNMFSKTIVIALFVLALEINSKGADLERYRNRVAAVTGSKSGIGFAITIALLKAGIHVVGIDIQEGIQQTITSSLPRGTSEKIGSFYAMKCDITDEGELLKVFKWIDDKLGGISIMINNAGAIRRATLIGGESAQYKFVWELNVQALSVCTREAFQSMAKHKRHEHAEGHIIHINSIAGHTMVSTMGHKMYNASKVAVTVLTDGLRHELSLIGSKIKVTGISPGLVDTNIFFLEPELKLFCPPQFFLKPQSVANAVMFVLDTPPDVVIAELILIATGMPIQGHNKPKPPYTI